MAAPKKPNTAAATAAVRRRGDETAAARLRARGWTVIPPEEAAAITLYDLDGDEIPEPPAGAVIVPGARFIMTRDGKLMPASKKSKPGADDGEAKP